MGKPKAPAASEQMTAAVSRREDLLLLLQLLQLERPATYQRGDKFGY
jgi:hypothetical protein